MTAAPSSSRRRVVVAAVVAAVVVAGASWWLRRDVGRPDPGTPAYEQATRHFYRGLAGLQVGLLDDARREFDAATVLAPGEPAIWANLGLTELRLGEFDRAAAAIAHAATLAPDRADVVFLQGRLDTARGQREAALTQLRRAVSLDPANLHARIALIEAIEAAGGSDADDEAHRVLEALVALVPANTAALVERARLAAKRGDGPVLRETVGRLQQAAETWPAEVVEQYRAVADASAAGQYVDASRALAFLRNVLARVPAFLEDRRAITPSAELIADPIPTFVRLAVPSARPSPADQALRFETATGGASGNWRSVVALTIADASSPVLVGIDGKEIRRVDTGEMLVPRPVADGELATMAVIDWNHDFRPDLAVAGPGGVRLLLQDEGGRFSDATGQASRTGGRAPTAASGVWAADIEMDGDLDLVVGVPGAPATVMRNNGDGTWRELQPFPGVTGVRGFAWADLDADGDPDAAMLDETGALHVSINLQAGQFRYGPGPGATAPVQAFSVGDVDADGRFELVWFDRAGTLAHAALDNAGWRTVSAGALGDLPAGQAPGRARLLLADVDNNGAVDVVASVADATGIWLMDETLSPARLAGLGGGATTVIVDMNGDGQLDLVGASGERVVTRLGRGTRGYHHHVVRPRAQTAAGDQRINSFGIGGEVETRAGLLVQKQVIEGETVHLGIGTRTAVDVTRIVWPNGVAQAEFDPAVDRPIVAEQRLKGSCPWVFADNGTGLQFVTDFLWRSPLGLRINASDTAGVTQTEDWVKIRGDQLVARDGVYDIRISAELWETHFVDHVSLMVVDHPSDADVFVDERFVPVAPPALAVQAMQPPTPVAQAWDESGRDVTAVVAHRDGRYLGSFARGRYQGVAADHFVEIDLGAPVASDVPRWLVAQGWIYPTDSSINVAIGQGDAVVPQGLSLEAQDGRGRWVTVASGLGFPAGKNKTVLIDLGQVARAGLAGARRLRLRTNLEIYWDALATAEARPDTPLRTTRLLPAQADLRYRGFSMTRTERREEPETPRYEAIASTTPRWRDLVGYYTRFGDVRALLERTEDRYVIMNAGDELRMTFTAPPPPPAGWTRDFVLIGDGWVKDGDFNTSFAKTVLPLPGHGQADYTAASPEPTLEEDPIYRRHAADWQTYHTRYVRPDAFLAGLRLPTGTATR